METPARAHHRRKLSCTDAEGFPGKLHDRRDDGPIEFQIGRKAYQPFMADGGNFHACSIFQDRQQ